MFIVLFVYTPAIMKFIIFAWHATSEHQGVTCLLIIQKQRIVIYNKAAVDSPIKD